MTSLKRARGSVARACMPARVRTQILPTEGKYVEGDRVRVELDLPGSGAAGTVTFAVNGRVTGQVLWTEGDVAYPAVCCKGSGEVVCDVEFLPAGAQQQ